VFHFNAQEGKDTIAGWERQRTERGFDCGDVWGCEGVDRNEKNFKTGEKACATKDKSRKRWDH
jgi:hypothetical protein